MNRGYVKVWRKIEDSGLIQLPNTLALFMHLLLNATHKDRKVGTSNGVVELKRGQFISGRIALAARLEQTERQVRTSLTRLEELGIISIQTTNKFSIYTIENYNKYQDSDEANVQQNDQQATNNRPASDKQTTTKQELNNLNIKEVKTKRNTATATRLPSDWLPTESDLDFCKTERPDLNAGRVANEFKDYWISVAGTKGVKADWSATWRNWVRRQSAQPASGQQKTKMDISGIDYKAGVNPDGSF